MFYSAKNGRIIVKVDYYAEFANGAHICTVDGHSLEDFYSNKAKSNKTLFVGQNGGISLK